MASKTNPGRAQGRRAYVSNAQRIPEDRVVWVNLFSGTISVDVYDEIPPEGVNPEDMEPGKGVSLRVSSRFERDKLIKIILSHLTEAELDAFERVMMRAVELARPTVVARDQHAREAVESGGSDYSRSYREVPRVVDRQGPSG